MISNICDANGFIPVLVDPYIHFGNKKFVYGEPFSYYSERPVHIAPPPGFGNTTDLNTNAREFSPRSPPSNDTIFRPLPPIIIYSKDAPPIYVYR